MTASAALRVVVVLPGEQPLVQAVAADTTTYAWLRDIIQGHLAVHRWVWCGEAMDRADDRYVVACDDEGIARGLEENRNLCGLGIVRGPFVVARTHRFTGEFIDIPDDALEELLRLLQLTLVEGSYV